MDNANTTIRLVMQSEQKSWDECVSHPLQSWAWGEFRKLMNIEVVRLGVFKKDKQKEVLVDGWQITFHKLPYLPLTIGYFPKGPAPETHMIDELITLGKEKNAIYIQLEPNVLSGCQLSAVSCQLLRPSHHPLFTRYTFVLDLTKSTDDLLRAMHPKTRYNIRVAQKHGVTVQEDNSSLAFQTYLELSRETTDRQGFYAHSDVYQKSMWETMQKAHIAHLFTATHNGHVLAAWILFCWKDTVYYPYGATSRDYRELMAPNFMLWQTALWAKKNGYTSYDLWGALGPNPDPADSWFGFHRFKEGYSPKHVEFIGSYDLVIQPALYKLYTYADTIRWKYLSLRKQF